MSELLLPLGGDIPLTAQAIATAAGGELTLPYRIELTGYTGDRAKMLLEIKRAIGGENNPSHYALELRIVCRGERCALWLKPSFDEKTRYAWRKHSISASMKPALAACLARYIAPYVDRPRVLDPFCGSGTLLFSCEEAFPCASLLGVDISQNAVQVAKENAAAGKSRARFVQKDVRRFEPREPADLVIANLPFGNRVGTHDDNRALYAAFLDKLPQLLAPGGVALLYTMEYRLLSSCLKRQGAPLLAETRRTEAGGLMPWVFLLQQSSPAALLT
jgi:23S rRNA G2445 N2-methylase RlmL